MKRSAEKAVISEGDENIGFVRGESKFVFSGGKILALKNGNIVESIAIEAFSRRPAQMFRLLQYATQNPTVLITE